MGKSLLFTIPALIFSCSLIIGCSTSRDSYSHAGGGNKQNLTHKIAKINSSSNTEKKPVTANKVAIIKPAVVKQETNPINYNEPTLIEKKLDKTFGKSISPAAEVVTKNDSVGKVQEVAKISAVDSNLGNDIIPTASITASLSSLPVSKNTVPEKEAKIESTKATEKEIPSIVANNTSPKFENNPAPVAENEEGLIEMPKAVPINNPEVLVSKYADMINVSPKNINNFPLFRFIDDWYGTEYRYGGTDNTGIDCSAFSQKLYGQVYGIELERTAREQRREAERIKHADDAEEGDLIFFRARRFRVSHVGVYLANGYFVHASSSQGVVISNLNNRYWKRRYAGCGRISRDEPATESEFISQ